MMLRLTSLLILLGACVGVPLSKAPKDDFGGEKLANGARVVAKLTKSLGGGILTQKPVTGLCDDVEQYAGYFNVTTETKNYFYWYFLSRNNPAKDPVVLWMTGGPGCSGSLALFSENGPCVIQSDLSTIKNPYSWNSNASIIFVDQPAGTGFSYGEPSDMDKNEFEVSRDMYHFMQAFYTAHPKMVKNPFHVFGESYGGHYVPATAQRIHRGNLAKEGIFIPLQGVGVGNGMTAPEIQYLHYSEYAFKNSFKPLVSKGVYNAMKAASVLCVEQIKLCQRNISICDFALNFCEMSQVVPVVSTGINLYDIRLPCSKPPLCYDFSSTESFLNLPEVVKMLGTEGHKWSACNMDVNKRFHKDMLQTMSADITELLEAGKRVLIYAGDMDYICNYMGNKAWSLQLDWEGKKGFNDEGDHVWSVVGQDSGLARTYSNFTFLQVYQAGHMVPMDQPSVSLNMLNTFLRNKPYYS